MAYNKTQYQSPVNKNKRIMTRNYVKRLQTQQSTTQCNKDVGAANKRVNKKVSATQTQTMNVNSRWDNKKVTTIPFTQFSDMTLQRFLDDIKQTFPSVQTSQLPINYNDYFKKEYVEEISATETASDLENSSVNLSQHNLSLPESLHDYFDTTDLHQLLDVNKTHTYNMNELHLKVMSKVLNMQYDDLERLFKLLENIPKNSMEKVLKNYTNTVAPLNIVKEDIKMVPETPEHIQTNKYLLKQRY